MGGVGRIPLPEHELSSHARTDGSTPESLGGDPPPIIRTPEPASGRFELQGSTNGVGPTLRRARKARGVTIDEASRDTRIRRDLLVALEEEDFDLLLGDVYIRGCLRSYSTYLGLPADHLVGRYAKYSVEPSEGPAAPPLPLETPIDAPRRRDNYVLFVMIAATLLILAAAFGILSSRAPAPTPADLSSEVPAVAGQAPGIVAVVVAEQRVHVTVTVDDGSAETFTLRRRESRSFQADVALTIRLDPGGSAQLTVNGNDKGFPGQPDRPWQETFSYESGGGTPSLSP